MILDSVSRRAEALVDRRVEERLALMDLAMVEALFAATVERRGRRISARGPGVRRRALEDSRLRFLDLIL